MSDNNAVIALADTGRADAASGKLDAAAASFERALRIEPRNPALWHELAKLRLQQGQYQQAEGLAARSNGWAGDNKTLRAENWRIIGQARLKRGDRIVIRYRQRFRLLCRYTGAARDQCHAQKK